MQNKLKGKTVAITGATGGIGQELCKFLLQNEMNLILLDRNYAKSKALGEELLKTYKSAKIEYITVDLSDLNSCKTACKKLKTKQIDFLIHNAGAYKIPRNKTKEGYDNVFQINFVSPYFITKQLMPYINEKVIVVGSIAHNYSKINANDIDFSNIKAPSKVYGNAKRFLMFSMFELFKKESKVKLVVAHPGITFTNITAHYPKLIFAIIKHPMKIIFHKPKKAMRPITSALSEDCAYHEWMGPRIFDIWGKPKAKKLKTCSEQESAQIGKIAEEIYNKLI